MEAIVYTAFDGELYDTGVAHLRILAQAPQHSISITETTVPPGFAGPVRHRHQRMTDMFYVLEGELAVDLDGTWRVLGEGSFVLVPPGAAHTFANRGSTLTRVLNIQQPSGLEQYLKEAFKRMAEGHAWSPAEMAEIAAGYEFEPVPGNESETADGAN